MGRHAQNARETIIDAAEDVVIDVGARHLTLQAVAKRTGVSKGGILYHFPNKESLLQAMLDRRFARLEENRRNRQGSLSEGPGNKIEAYVRSSLEQDDRTRKLGAAVHAAAAHDPHLLLPYREKYRRLLDEFVEDGLSLERAATIMLAVDALKLTELLSFTYITGEEREAIVREIIALAKEEVHDP